MPFIELFDETLDINSTENYELSLQAGSDSLSFCILDTIRNKYVMLRSIEAEEGNELKINESEDFLQKDDFLIRHYKKVNILLPSRKFTLVPSQLFDPGRKAEFFTFNHIKEENEVILSNKSTETESFILFSASQQLTEVLNRKFPGVLPFHSVKTLFNHIARMRKGSESNYIQLHIERDFFFLIIYTHGILKFCNSFTYRSINDILYYVLNTFKSLGVKQEEAICLSGNAEKYDDLSSAFSMYISQLKYSEPSGNFTFSYVFNDLVLHRYLNLFTVVNCES